MSVFIALIGGFLAFTSPCVLPLIPAYLAYISGMTFAEMTKKEMADKVRQKTMLHSLFFILGFTLVFVFLGTSASAFGGFLKGNRDLIRILGGLLIIIMGLFLIGIVKIQNFYREYKFSLSHKPLGYTGSFLVGVTFAAGWTPCVGPILATILVLASQTESVYHGMILLFFFSLGMAVPFLIISLFVNTFLTYFQEAKKYLHHIQVGAGIFLVIVGFLMLTGWFNRIAQFLVSFGA
ncbi:MAG: cytochrome c biogenesis protein CcdA [bacterium]